MPRAEWHSFAAFRLLLSALAQRTCVRLRRCMNVFRIFPHRRDRLVANGVWLRVIGGFVDRHRPQVVMQLVAD